MTASPFKAVLIFTCEDGSQISYPCTVSDVVGEYYTFPDGSDSVTLPAIHGVLFLTDVILSDVGADTSQAELYINGKFSGEKILNSANKGDVFNRQFMSSPIAIAPGARLKIKQVA